MGLTELMPDSRLELARGSSAVLVAAERPHPALRECLLSLIATTDVETPIVVAVADPALERGLRDLLAGPDAPVRELYWCSAPPPDPPDPRIDPLTRSANAALQILASADVALLTTPTRVPQGWLERLTSAAYEDTNTATASALSTAEGPLGLGAGASAAGLEQLAERVTGSSLRLRPRLGVAVGPCVFLRRDALELVGPLDEGLELGWALEVDFAQRCLLAGLCHVAGDDLAVEPLAGVPPLDPSTAPAPLPDRYPYLSRQAPAAASEVLSRALHAAGRSSEMLWVTIDARALSGTLTGTQRHIFELIRALAATGAARLRLLVSSRDGHESLDQIASLAHVDLLAIESLDEDTPRSPVFHRPQQVFGPPDMQLALRLGERIVLNQLDLIAYRNPGYHRDATAWRSHRRVTRQALGAADRVIVFSAHTRAELLSDDLAEGERIRVIPPGLDHPVSGERRRPSALDAGAGAGPGQEDEADFLLCLGTDFRHKNRLFALRLLATLRERHGWEGRLVLAGTHVPHGSSRALEDAYLAGQPELARAVVMLGAVDEAEKAWLIDNARLVLYPSTYEGFGLVPFEAALAGVPCVFAAQSSLAEVLPAELADVVRWSVEATAERTHELLVDEGARRRQVERIAEQGRRLTWESAADATIAAYGEALISPVRESAVLSRDELDREHELRELVADQNALVALLATERDHAKTMYDELHAEVGFGLSLIGPKGALPEDVQRALLALDARPGIGGPLFRAGGAVFRAGRRIARLIGRSAGTPG